MVIQQTLLSSVPGVDPSASRDVNSLNTMCGQPGEKLSCIQAKINGVCEQVVKIK